MHFDEHNLSFVAPHKRNEVRAKIRSIESYIANPTAATAKAVSGKLGISERTLHLLVRIWRDKKQPADLVGSGRPRKRKSTLTEQQTTIIGEAVKDRSDDIVERIVERAHALALQKGVDLPSATPLRRAIKKALGARLPDNSFAVGADFVVDHIAVDPVLEDYVPLRCTDEEYAEGLSERHHETLVAWTEAENVESNTPRERRLARATLNAVIREAAPEMATRHLKRAARIVETGAIKDEAGNPHVPSEFSFVGQPVPHRTAVADRKDGGTAPKMPRVAGKSKKATPKIETPIPETGLLARGKGSPVKSARHVRATGTASPYDASHDMTKPSTFADPAEAKLRKTMSAATAKVTGRAKMTAEPPARRTGNIRGDGKPIDERCSHRRRSLVRRDLPPLSSAHQDADRDGPGAPSRHQGQRYADARTARHGPDRLRQDDGHRGVHRLPDAIGSLRRRHGAGALHPAP